MSNKKFIFPYLFKTFHVSFLQLPSTHTLTHIRNIIIIIITETEWASRVTEAHSFYIYDCLQISFKAYFRNTQKRQWVLRGEGRRDKKEIFYYLKAAKIDRIRCVLGEQIVFLYSTRRAKEICRLLNFHIFMIFITPFQPPFILKPPTCVCVSMTHENNCVSLIARFSKEDNLWLYFAENFHSAKTTSTTHLPRSLSLSLSAHIQIQITIPSSKRTNIRRACTK